MYEEVSAERFVEELKKAPGWALMRDTENVRLLLVVREKEKPNKYFASPNALEMTTAKFETFTKNVRRVVNERGLMGGFI